LNCAYCHNRELLTRGNSPRIPVESVLATLRTRRGFLDGLVISGGEPTLQEGLESFIREVRSMGFAVKLDTNGTRPRVLKRLLSEGLLDYVAMDAKAPYGLYEDVCGGPVDLDAVHESVRCLVKSSTPFEFRTTVLPYFRPRDIADIGAAIHGAPRYVLQQFRPDKEIALRDPRLAEPPHTAQWFDARVAELNPQFPDVLTRGVRQRAVSTG
jgi:pyruvate formate lyase activating enzyme